MIEKKHWVLQVTRNLPPLLGGMERLNLRLASALASRFQVAVIGPAGCRAYLAEKVRVHEVSIKPLPWFLFCAAIMSGLSALMHRPKWIVAGSGLMAPVAWVAARLVGGRCMVYAHGLDLIVPHRLYQTLWLPFVRRADCLVVNSANTAQLAHEKGVMAERIRVVNPGVDIPDVATLDARPFRRNHGLADRPLLLSVGRLTPRKGLCQFVESCLPALLQRHPDMIFLVIGDDPQDALTSTGRSERERIGRAAVKAGVSNAIRFLPPCSDADLSQAYASCDVHVFPIIEIPGDVEGFGMVAVEAAAHGLPTLAFDVGGVSDAIVPGVTGDLICSGDFDAMTEAVSCWLVRSRENGVRVACHEAARRWAWPVFDKGIHEALRDFEE